MKKINNIIIMLLSVIIFTAVGCNDADYKVIDNAIYIVSQNSGNSQKVTIDDDGGDAIVLVRTSSSSNNDIKTNLFVDQQALDNYNRRNGTNYVLLPDSLFSLSSAKTNIQAGKITAEPVSVKFESLPKNLLDTGNKYALPISVSCEDRKPLESLKSMIYIMDQVIVTSVPIMNAARYAYLNLQKDYSLNEWSVEFRVNMSVLGTKIGQMNNQALLSAGPTELYIRFGDAPIRGDVLQVKTHGTQINCRTQFNAKQWYHLAFVCSGTELRIYVDGILDSTLALPGTPYNLKGHFTLCGSGSYLKADVMMSEFRFWSKAISQNQIQNNMYVANPQTEGLEGYWKMNEGRGIIFNDATGHGNTGAVQNESMEWKNGVRSDDK